MGCDETGLLETSRILLLEADGIMICFRRRAWSSYDLRSGSAMRGMVLAAGI
jgi:hypothetical protein